MLRAGFGSKLAWLADREQEIVFVGARRRGRPARRPARGGGRHPPARRLPARRHDELAPGEAPGRADRAAAAEGLPERAGDVQILDVRERSEWDEGHIPGSAFMPWHDIDAVPDGLDPERPIAVVCASGERAAVAASLVQRTGAEHVIHVIDGGVPAWSGSGIRLAR